MSQGLETLAFALIAGYLFYRLWSVLGQNTDRASKTQQKGLNPSAIADRPLNKMPLVEGSGHVITLSPRTMAAEELLTESAFEGLLELRKRQPNFDLAHFALGAQAAFRLLVQAFAKGELPPLKKFLSEPLYKQFAKAIEQREKNDYKQESRIDSLKVLAINDISLNKTEITITVKFLSEQMLATQNSKGEILDNPAKISVPMIDIWSFSRRFDDQDPNWTIVATNTEPN